jgi:hypothetical protein
MSAAAEIVRRSDDGVLLKYRTDIRGPHHDAQRVWPSDRLRTSILRSEHELRRLRRMAECLAPDLSDIAIDLFEDAFRTIEATLNLARDEIARRVAP